MRPQRFRHILSHLSTQPTALEPSSHQVHCSPSSTVPLHAFQLPNRGPRQGGLSAAALSAYERDGFLTLPPGTITPAELEELRAESERIIEGLPAEPGGDVDRAGRPAICSAQFGDVLGDPNAGRGRYAAGIQTHTPDGEAAQVPYKIGSWFTYSDPFLRLYGHPRLLRAVESVYGEEFVPFNESMVIKRGEIAPAISWHQVRPSGSDSDPALRQPVAFQVLADTHTGARMAARTGTGSGPSTDLISW